MYDMLSDLERAIIVKEDEEKAICGLLYVDR